MKKKKQGQISKEIILENVCDQVKAYVKEVKVFLFRVLKQELHSVLSSEVTYSWLRWKCARALDLSRVDVLLVISLSVFYWLQKLTCLNLHYPVWQLSIQHHFSPFLAWHYTSLPSSWSSFWRKLCFLYETDLFQTPSQNPIHVQKHE